MKPVSPAGTFSAPVTTFGVEVLMFVVGDGVVIPVRVTVAVAVPQWPSLTCTWKVSVLTPTLGM